MAKELNLTPHRQIVINKKEIVDVVFLKNLEINGNVLQEVEAAIIDMNNETFSGRGLSGILGLNVINQFVWDFDLKKNKWQVIDQKPKIDKEFLLLNYMKVEPTGLPYLKTETEFMKSDSLFFDTGFNGFLSINYLTDTTRLNFQKFIFERKDIFGTKETISSIYMGDKFNLFGTSFDQKVIIYNVHPKEEKDLLGTIFIQCFDRFIFDPFNAQILLSKN